MFETENYFDQLEEEKESRFGNLGQLGAKVGKWLGFIGIGTVLAFSALHGISATLQFSPDSLVGRITGIVGILTVELILCSLILKFHNREITGTTQTAAAIGVFGVGILLSALATITDSRLNAGLELTDELAFFLRWVLPVSPLIMGLGNHIVDELSPEQNRSRQQAEEMRALSDSKFAAHIASQRAQLKAQRQIANAQLNARAAAAHQVVTHYQSDEVQQAIRHSALGSIPALLRGIGVDPAIIPDLNQDGELDLGEVADFLAVNPDKAAAMFRLMRERDMAESWQEIEVVDASQTGHPIYPSELEAS